MRVTRSRPMPGGFNSSRDILVSYRQEFMEFVADMVPGAVPHEVGSAVHYHIWGGDERTRGLGWAVDMRMRTSLAVAALAGYGLNPYQIYPSDREKVEAGVKSVLGISLALRAARPSNPTSSTRLEEGLGMAGISRPLDRDMPPDVAIGAKGVQLLTTGLFPSCALVFARAHEQQDDSGDYPSVSAVTHFANEWVERAWRATKEGVAQRE